MKKLLAFFSILTIFLGKTLSLPTPQNSTLILTHILFRHGDRTPEIDKIFPKNPYKNETFFPFGFGELTLDGKKRAYSLGLELRKRYDEFLGPIYFKELIEATTSGANRALMSLQAVLAGLFPPSKEFELQGGFPWQPTVFEVLDTKTDKLLAVFKNCKPMTQIETKINEKTKELYEYLSENTGVNITNFIGALRIHHSLKILKNLNYDLPDWSDSIWPEPLRTAGLKSWRNLIDFKLPVISGHLLKKIVEDTRKKLDGTLVPEGRKMFLYSGHDVNIVGMLGSLGIYDGREINFSAYISIEVHEIDGVRGVKVFFENYDGSEPELVQLPNCERFCPLDKFEELLYRNYPKNPWCY